VLFLLFFLICGVAGAAAHLAAYWGSTAPVIGASGAVSGLMAAGFRMLPSGSGDDPAALAPLFSRRILAWTAVWAAINAFAGITGFGAGPGPAVIAWGAHLGGYAAGLVLAGPFDRLARS
jgi:membrane associated rhomboid family serine protease